jgi:hypothetical protein
MANLLKHTAPSFRKYDVSRVQNLNAAAFNLCRTLVKKTRAVKEKIGSKLSSVCGHKPKKANRFRKGGGFYQSVSLPTKVVALPLVMAMLLSPHLSLSAEHKLRSENCEYMVGVFNMTQEAVVEHLPADFVKRLALSNTGQVVLRFDATANCEAVSYDGVNLNASGFGMAMVSAQINGPKRKAAKIAGSEYSSPYAKHRYMLMAWMAGPDIESVREAMAKAKLPTTPAKSVAMTYWGDGMGDGRVVSEGKSAPIAWEEALMGAGYKMKFGADVDLAAAQTMMNIQCLFPQQLEGTFSLKGLDAQLDTTFGEPIEGAAYRTAESNSSCTLSFDVPD